MPSYRIGNHRLLGRSAHTSQRCYRCFLDGFARWFLLHLGFGHHNPSVISAGVKTNCKKCDSLQPISLEMCLDTGHRCFQYRKYALLQEKTFCWIFLDSYDSLGGHNSPSEKPCVREWGFPIHRELESGALPPPKSRKPCQHDRAFGALVEAEEGSGWDNLAELIPN